MLSSEASCVEDSHSLTLHNPLICRATTITKQKGPNQLLQDYYKCLKEFGEIESKGEPSGEQGFFQFGAGTLCYGNCYGGSVANQPTGLRLEFCSLVSVLGSDERGDLMGIFGLKFIRCPIGITSVMGGSGMR